MNINVYDFDYTIYDGDVSVDFWKFNLRIQPMIILFLPLQFIAVVLMKFKLISRQTAKEVFFSYLRFIKSLPLTEFWEEHQDKIKPWYLSQRKSTDLIISASPEFLILPIAKQLDFRLIGTKMSTSTGKISGKNCRDVEKVHRFKAEYGETKINKFYSDSLADQPLKQLANRAFLVNKNITKPWI